MTEGEKCSALLAKLDLVATSPAHGAKSPHKSDWSPLAGKDAVILPDADAPGEGFAKNLVSLLAKLKPAPTVRIVRLPGLPEVGDVEQWLQALADVASPAELDHDEARDELLRLADFSPVEEFAGEVEVGPPLLPAAGRPPLGPTWEGEPRPIASKLRPVPPFPRR